MGKPATATPGAAGMISETGWNGAAAEAVKVVPLFHEPECTRSENAGGPGRPFNGELEFDAPVGVTGDRGVSCGCSVVGSIPMLRSTAFISSFCACSAMRFSSLSCIWPCRAVYFSSSALRRRSSMPAVELELEDTLAAVGEGKKLPL